MWHVLSRKGNHRNDYTGFPFVDARTGLLHPLILWPRFLHFHQWRLLTRIASRCLQLIYKPPIVPGTFLDVKHADDDTVGLFRHTNAQTHAHTQTHRSAHTEESRADTHPAL